MLRAGGTAVETFALDLHSTKRPRRFGIDPVELRHAQLLPLMIRNRGRPWSSNSLLSASRRCRTVRLVGSAPKQVSNPEPPEPPGWYPVVALQSRFKIRQYAKPARSVFLNLAVETASWRVHCGTQE